MADEFILDPTRVIAQLGDEIGMLSVANVQGSMKLNAIASLLVAEQSANANLRLALEARDADIKVMRETLVEQRDKLAARENRKK